MKIMVYVDEEKSIAEKQNMAIPSVDKYEEYLDKTLSEKDAQTQIPKYVKDFYDSLPSVNNILL